MEFVEVESGGWLPVAPNKRFPQLTELHMVAKFDTEVAIIMIIMIMPPTCLHTRMLYTSKIITSDETKKIFR